MILVGTFGFGCDRKVALARASLMDTNAANCSTTLSSYFPWMKQEGC